MGIPLHLGVRAHDFTQVPLKDLIEKIQFYNFAHIQFALKKSFPDSTPSLTAISPGTASYYGNAFRQAGIQMAVLGCYVNIIDTDPFKRAQALAEFNTHLRLARDFGASLVGTETGSVGRGYTTANFTEQAFQEVVTSVKVMVAEAERFGVTVGIEAGLHHPLYSASLTRRLLDEIPSNNLQVILDCANLMSPTNFLHQEAIIMEALKLLGNRMVIIHLKDFIVQDGVIKIVPVGQGWLEFEPILRYMKYERPHIQGILESTPESHLRESIAFLQRIYEDV
jgi:sugar phosphate isomerase/epimerase